MNRNVLATAVAATLALSAPQAFAEAKGTASKAEVQAIEAQMKALAERLSRLEAANNTLQNQNAELKATVDRRDAEIDYLKAQTKDLREAGAIADTEISKVKGADWATRIKFKGDLRVRDENIVQERVANGAVEDAADRNRARLRARFGFDAKVTDHSKVVVQLSTGGDDPRSTNQTIGGSTTRKAITFDHAYADWNFAEGSDLMLGKFKYPFWRPGQSMLFDGDISPEGVAVTFDRGMFFGSGYGWWLEERFNSNPDGKNADTYMLGGQLGLKFPLLGGETRLAASYYDLSGGKGSNPFYALNANGNTTVAESTATDALQVLKYDYNVAMLGGEVGLTVAGLPLSIWGDYAINTASGVEDDTAYGVGVTLGKASSARTWEAGVFYESVGKDALFAQLIDSDFGDGVADADGWVLKGGYAPVKNIVLNATYFINTRHVCGNGNSPNNRECGTGIADYDLNYNRLQLDVNYKF